MVDCECLNSCPFFNDKMKDKDGLRKICKEQYCYGTYTDCARYRVSKKLGDAYIPKDLYPNMHERAEKIISRSINTDAVPADGTVEDIIRNLFSPVGSRR